MDKPRSNRGFAAMDPAKQRAIASKGGIRAHETGRAHEFTTEEARTNGIKGGNAVVARYGKEHMQRIGRMGGSAKKNARNTVQQ